MEPARSAFSFRNVPRLRARSEQQGARPLVLIHGMSGAPSMWDPVAHFLAETREVHAVALAGHRGGPAILDPNTFTSAGYVDAAEAELDRLGIDQADLVGNSLGGWVALQLAGRGRATSVVCLAPAGGWAVGGTFDRFLAAQFGLAYRACRRLVTPRRRRVLMRPGVRRTLLSSMVARPDRVSDAEYTNLVEDIADCDALRISMRRVAARDVHAVPALDIPVLIAWSDRDRILISRASRRNLERQIGRPEIIRLPNVGHVPMSDAPELVASTILDFAERTVRGPGVS